MLLELEGQIVLDFIHALPESCKNWTCWEITNYFSIKSLSFAARCWMHEIETFTATFKTTLNYKRQSIERKQVIMYLK